MNSYLRFGSRYFNNIIEGWTIGSVTLSVHLKINQKSISSETKCSVEGAQKWRPEDAAKLKLNRPQRHHAKWNGYKTSHHLVSNSLCCRSANPDRQDSRNFSSRYVWASGICARCRRPILYRCTRCLEARVYDECVLKPTFYCSPVCQKADWGQHKSQYRKLRLHASPLRFKSIQVGTSRRFDNISRQVFVRWLCDRSLLEIVLMYIRCMKAIIYLLRYLYSYLNNLGINIISVIITSTYYALRFFY